MKIVVSYINSLYDKDKTIALIDKSIADGIHIDLMDGKYVANNNYNAAELLQLLSGVSKPLDIHLMTIKPSAYFPTLFKLNPECIYIHPSTETDAIKVLKDIVSQNIKAGIAINPNEEISQFNMYFPYVSRVLLMSVVPGEGGQTFLDTTPARLAKLKEYQKDYSFEIYVDGGINDQTIKYVKLADGVVSGSYICNSNDYNQQINNLKK